VWELICDHRYQWGTIAADRSPWHSDGIPTDVSPLPGDAGLKFSNPQSQIAIPRKPHDPWGVLGGIVVEITARLAQPNGTLIDAHQSFRMSVAGGILTGEIPGRQFSGGDIPVGRWTRMSFNHNGFNTLGSGYETLGGNGGSGGGGATLIPYGQVPPVGPQGILIGSRIGAASQRLVGDIASVRIWRIDPQSRVNEFLGRPFNEALSECWSEFLRKLAEALRNDPKCAQWLVRFITAFYQKFQQALAQKSPAKIEEFRQMCREYRELWRAGQVGSPQTLALIARLRDWLRAEGLLSLDDPELMAMSEHPCMKRLSGSLPSLDCDPEVKALIEAIIVGGRDPRANGQSYYRG
jgi:hypothetical protein